MDYILRDGFNSNKFASVEKIEGTIWKYGNLSLKTVINNGTENKSTGNRIDNYYYKEFDSGKYANRPRLDEIDISFGAFLVLSYVEWSKDRSNGPEAQCQLYMSFKQVDIIKTFFEEACNEIVDNIDAIYKKDGITKKYENWIKESVKLSGDKTISVYPEKLFTNENVPYNGVIIVLTNENDEEFYTEISLDAFITLVGIIQNYDLLTDGRLVSIQGLLYQILMDCSSGNNNTSSASRNVNSSLRGRRGSSSGSTTRRRPTRSIKDVIDEEDEDEEDNDIEEIEDVKPTKKTVRKKSVSEKKPTKTKKAEIIDLDEDDNETTSLDAMLSAADEVEFSLDDDDDADTIF